MGKITIKQSKGAIMLLIIIGTLFIAGIVQGYTGHCEVGEFIYGSSAITAYAKIQANKCPDANNSYDNFLECHCVGWQNKNGNLVREDGGIKQGYDVSSVESRIWVNWGAGTTYTNNYYGRCEGCGDVYRTDNLTFNFSIE